MTGPGRITAWALHAMKIRTSVLVKYLKDHISGKYGLGGDTPPHVRRPFAAVRKATFSFAMVVMNKVEGWNEEKWVGSFFAASMWIYTKAVFCDGRKRDPLLHLQLSSRNYRRKCKLGD